jgi:SAM-dependent methyltransferase
LDEFPQLEKVVKALDSVRDFMIGPYYRERVEALDRLDAYDLDSPLPKGDVEADKVQVYRRARALKAELETANSKFYENLREAVRLRPQHDVLLRWTPQPGEHEGGEASGSADSYDYLDELASGVLRFAAPETPKVSLSAEMVAYQPTPARHIFELCHRMKFEREDVFIDLGCGLGHVPLLIAACTSAQTVGIEIEPAYVEVARRCAVELHLSQATFLAQDAREADISRGTVFYLYTPFRGAILRAVLDRLRDRAHRRAIRVCTFGPCTPIVDAESWLVHDPMESGHISVFRSR